MTINTLKIRDDHTPLEFTANGDVFKTPPGVQASWLTGETFGHRELRNRIEPWLTSLFQSEHLSLLAGSGLTHAVHYLAAGKGAAGMGALALSHHQTEINQAAETAAEAAGREKGNLEDQLRVANELLRGLEILQQKTEAEALRTELQTGMQDFAKSILKSEEGIASAAEDKREEAFNTLVTFLMSFASRTGARDRLNIFTTNYDRLIEAGAELAGLHLLDRFLGKLMPIFRCSRLDLDMHYNPPGIRGEPRYLEGVARYTKLHGSVDWVQTGKDIRRIGLPFGAASVDPYLQAPGLSEASAHGLMIYPNAAKDRETADYPYVELFRFSSVVFSESSSAGLIGKALWISASALPLTLLASWRNWRATSGSAARRWLSITARRKLAPRSGSGPCSTLVTMWNTWLALTLGLAANCSNSSLPAAPARLSSHDCVAARSARDT